MAAPAGWFGTGNRRTPWIKSAGSGTLYEWYGFVSSSSVGRPGLGYPSTPTGVDKWVFGLARTDNTGFRAAAAAGVNSGWQHVAMVGTGGAAPSIYVNGTQLSASTAGPSGTRTGNSPGALRIGGSGFSADGWLGSMAALAFFPTALSGAAIGSIAGATSFASAQSTILGLSPSAFWGLQGGSMTDAVAGHNGSVAVGAPVFGVGGPWPGSLAVWFDGVSRIDIPDHNAWSSAGFTICGWLDVSVPAYPGWRLGTSHRVIPASRRMIVLR